MKEETQTAKEPESTQRSRTKNKRIFWLVMLASLFLVAGAAYGAYWFLVARYYESTDDAYVNGNQVVLMPQISGIVTAIHAENTDLVRHGQSVVELDRTDAEVALDRAKANLAQTVREVRQLYQQEAAQQATVALRQSQLVQAQHDYQRYKDLVTTHGVSLEQYQHARTAWEEARASLNEAQHTLEALQAMTAHTDLSHHPRVVLAAARLEQAYIDLKRTTLPAPVTGYVAERSVQVGQEVKPGKPLLAIVPLDQIWVDANFKETQLDKIRIGQPADVTADLYGGVVHYHGRVLGLSPGTGSAFELLPPQNATGNWIKVVQRVPVRIGLDWKQLEAHPLRLGLSMEVSVDAHDTSGPMLARTPESKAVYSTDVYRREQSGMKDLINQIIRDNAGDTEDTNTQRQ